MEATLRHLIIWDRFLDGILSKRREDIVVVSLAIYQPYKVDLSSNHGDIPIQIFAINRSDVSVDEALAEQYQITLDELWENYFGPSSYSSSVLPFVNDNDWLIWSDWGSLFA